MNFPLVFRVLSTIALLIAGMMAFSLLFAIPGFSPAVEFETRGFFAILGSIACSIAAWAGLRRLGRKAEGQIFRKEAMAVVGLSWMLATVLGALPYAFAGTARGYDHYRSEPIDMNYADWLFESQSGFSTTGATVITELEEPELVPRCILFWRSSTHFLGGLGIIVLFVAVLGQGSAGKALMRAEMPGPSKEGTQTRMQQTALWFAGIYCGLTLLLTILLMIQGMSLFDALCHAFGTMATGGFSTYNASVGHFASQPEQYHSAAIEMTILVFMVLAGTNFTLLYFLLMRKAGLVFRDVEWRTYLLIILFVTGMIMAFGLYHGDFDPDPPGAENGQTEKHIEQGFGARLWRAFRYGSFQVVSIITTTGFGTHDFDGWNGFGRGVLFLLMFVGGCAGSTGGGLKVIRHVLFLKILKLEIEKSFHPTVVRPLRLGGVPVDDQNLRRNIVVFFGLALAIFIFSWLLLVAFEPDSTWTGPDAETMFPLFDKNRDGLISETEIPKPDKLLFVQMLALGDRNEDGRLDEREFAKAWQGRGVPSGLDNKLIDSASGVAATLNNIGPGLGTIGATQNYAHFSDFGKLLFTFLMMLGRLEIFPILVLVPGFGFWRSR